MAPKIKPGWMGCSPPLIGWKVVTDGINDLLIKVCDVKLIPRKEDRIGTCNIKREISQPTQLNEHESCFGSVKVSCGPTMLTTEEIRHYYSWKHPLNPKCLPCEVTLARKILKKFKFHLKVK